MWWDGLVYSCMQNNANPYVILMLGWIAQRQTKHAWVACARNKTPSAASESKKKTLQRELPSNRLTSGSIFWGQLVTNLPEGFHFFNHVLLKKVHFFLEDVLCLPWKPFVLSQFYCIRRANLALPHSVVFNLLMKSSHFFQSLLQCCKSKVVWGHVSMLWQTSFNCSQSSLKTCPKHCKTTIQKEKNKNKIKLRFKNKQLRTKGSFYNTGRS